MPYVLKQRHSTVIQDSSSDGTVEPGYDYKTRYPPPPHETEQDSIL